MFIVPVVWFWFSLKYRRSQKKCSQQNLTKTGMNGKLLTRTFPKYFDLFLCFRPAKSKKSSKAMVTFRRYLKQPSVCQPQIDTVMILQMDELKPERSGCRSGLDWDTRGMTSALLPYKVFETAEGHLTEPNSFSDLHLTCPSCHEAP